jgi:DNA repair protein RAD7
VTLRYQESGYNSDDLDGIAEQPKPKKKLTKAQLEKEKAKAKAEAKKRKRLDDDTDEDEEGYAAPSKGVNTAKPDIGSFTDCAKCGKKFTVVRTCFCGAV